MSSMLLPQDDAHFLKTSDPHVSASGIMNLLQALRIAGVARKAQMMPEHVITGPRQMGVDVGHTYRSRPAFYVETPNGFETILRADFQKVQFALTIRENPQIDNHFQVDEVDIVLHEDDLCNPGVTFPREIKLDCSNDEDSKTLLDSFLKDFSKAVTGIAELHSRSHGNTYAEFYALRAAKAALNSQDDLGMKEGGVIRQSKDRNSRKIGLGDRSRNPANIHSRPYNEYVNKKPCDSLISQAFLAIVPV